MFMKLLGFCPSFSYGGLHKHGSVSSDFVCNNLANFVSKPAYSVKTQPKIEPITKPYLYHVIESRHVKTLL